MYRPAACRWVRLAVAVAADTNALAVVDVGENLDLQRLMLLDLALAVAGDAGVKSSLSSDGEMGCPCLPER